MFGWVIAFVSNRHLVPHGLLALSWWNVGLACRDRTVQHGTLEGQVTS